MSELRINSSAEAAVKEAADSDDEFQPAWWLPGPHLQAVWSALARKGISLQFRREILPTPDGDELVLDHVDGAPGSPRVLLLHGLEGSSYSSYVQGLASTVAARGWRVTALNFRHCARDPQNLAVTLSNKLPRLYHSGDSSDVSHVIHTLHEREPDAPLLAAGASLGGSVLLKAMGEDGDRCPLVAAMAISVPYCLAAGARNLENTMGRLYLESFLKTLRPKVMGLVGRFPEIAKLVDFDAFSRSRSFRDMDNRLTAPLHGFQDAEEYYARCSSLGFAQRVKVPTLALSADDDPFVAREAVDRLRRASPDAFRIVTTARGGHVGFVGGTPWNPHYWFERLFIAWMERWAHARRTSQRSSSAAA